MMPAPATRSSSPLRAFTVAWVPTGMNTGVGIEPCGVCSTPARAPPSVAISSNVTAAAVLMMLFYSMSMASP